MPIRRADKPRRARETPVAYRAGRPGGLTRAQARSIDDLRARLKQVLPDGGLKSLILYGSRARRDARPDSDIDLFIVYDSNRSDTRELIGDLVNDAVEEPLNRGEAAPLNLQAFVMTEADLERGAAQGLPLLQNIAREGIVLEGVPVEPSPMDRNHWVSEYLDDAKEQLETAKLVLDHGDVRRAISLAYFIYLDAARAALIAKGIAPKSHAGSRSLFGKHFIKTGIVPRKFAAHFDRMEKDRLEATYTLQKQFTKEDAGRALELAEELLGIVQKLIPGLLEEGA
jgi:uncharacterized protein (UPF0332 family)